MTADDVEDDRESYVDPNVGEDRVSNTVLPGEVPDGDGQIDVQGLRQAADQEENDSLHHKTEGSFRPGDLTDSLSSASQE